MKLKKWLILSHLAVMLTPILTSILLYNLISSYHKKDELNDYINSLSRYKVYEDNLNNPKLYTDFTMKNTILNVEDKNTIQISMYNSNGQKLYSSDDSIIYTKSKEDLYSNLYKITTGYKAYTLKKPVFNENVLVGFYEITIARQNFIEGVNIKTIMAAVCFVITLTASSIYNYNYPS
ncbi:MAG: sensor histidine kinase, partial [Clostridiaceae bacterium]|nr:sensor histidine kinase [Clostridiaceae bacterium]